MQFLRQLLSLLLAPVRLLLAPEKLLAVPGKLQQLPLPAVAALIVGLFLAVCIVTGFVTAMTVENLDAKAKVKDLPWLILLVPVIAWVTYYGVRLWMEADSGYEDIDRAWKAGLAELERHGLNLHEIPVFLVHGTESIECERDLFTASRQKLLIANFPPGAAALHWFASREFVFLVCSDVGRLCELAKSAAKIGPSTLMAPMSEADYRNTMMPPRDPIAERPPTEPAVTAAPALQFAGAPAYDVRGTMMVNPQDIREMAGRTMPPPGVAATATSQLKRGNVERQTRRLAYLCQLLHRARRPLCPINGMLTVLPFRMLACDGSQGAEIKEAVRKDVTQAVSHLKLRFPVNVLITGMEQDRGFAELVQRVGKERALNQRIGKGFGVWDPPISEEVAALCKHACGAFEDFVYYLFREKDALSKPGNRLLYSLLCKVRREIEPRLDRILVDGLALDADKEPLPEPPLVSGCYFAATGESEEEHAFTKAVLEKFFKEGHADQGTQEELAWTDEAAREDERYQRIGMVALVVNLLFLLAIGGWIWSKYKSTRFVAVRLEKERLS